MTSRQILIDAGFVDMAPSDAAGIQGLLLRFKKGIRWRTLRIRALPLMKIRGWADLFNDGCWPMSEAEVEDYMIDVAGNSKVGVSAFDRARYAILYIEAAAGVPESERTANGDTLRATIKEIVLGISKGNPISKKETPTAHNFDFDALGEVRING